MKYSSTLPKKSCWGIHNLPFNTHTTEYFQNAKNLRTNRSTVYKSQISKHMFKCRNLNANILPKHSDVHNYSTRNNNIFIATKCDMRKSEMSINFKSIKIWNKLPADIRTSDSLNVLMYNLRNYYTFHATGFITDVFFYFLRCTASLCNFLCNKMTIFH